MDVHIVKNDCILDDSMLPIEPYFLYAKSKELARFPGRSSDTLLRYINYKIAENPESITQHVRKIKLLQAGWFEQELLFAALIDLFLLLKEKGFDLRKRMLLSSKDYLSKLMFAKLHGKLECGDITEGDRWSSAVSMLPIKKENNFKVSIVDTSLSRFGPAVKGGPRYGL